jgi:hypothetical protein
MKTVGCRIKVINTGLFCEIEIGRRSGKDFFFWTRLENKMARLSIGENGGWGYMVDAADKTTGITILPPSPEKVNPDGSKTYKAIADLDNVPEDFLDRALCGNYLNGSGLWILTREAVIYELFYPCV